MPDDTWPDDITPQAPEPTGQGSEPDRHDPLGGLQPPPLQHAGEGQGDEVLPTEAVLVPQPSRRGVRGRVAVAVAIVVVLVAAGVGTSIALSGSSSNTGGASSPGGAVAALLAAADNSDVIGALDTLAPGERAALEPGLQNIVSQLKRLKVLSSAADLNHIAGTSLQFGGIRTRTDYLSSDVAAVSLTSGKVTSSVVPSQLPLGSFVKDLAGAALGGPSKTRTTPVSTTDCGQTAAQMAGCTSVIGTVKLDGSWYVSIGYSIAIDALKDTFKSEAPPASSQAVQAVGATTPQAPYKPCSTRSPTSTLRT